MNPSPDSPPPSSSRRGPGRAWRLLLPLLVLVSGAAIAVALVKTSPKAQRKRPPHPPRLVEVERVTLTNLPARVQVMGTVQPSREVDLRPRVTGAIEWVSEDFVPGGRLAQGEPLLRIDPTDYLLAVRQRESEVAQARASLKLEEGRQTVAVNDYALLGEVIREEDRDFVLRKPQFDQVAARLKSAEAQLDQARTNLARTTVRAPFNAVIRARHVNLGAQVSPSTVLATLIGTDEYWIQVTVPLNQLRWMFIPGYNAPTGSVAHVYDEAAWGKGVFREGRVVRLLADLEKEGRMAQVLVEVQDPLSLKPADPARPKMVLGDYVRVEIEGRELKAVAAVDRQCCRDGDCVWLLDDKNQLEVRPVKVAFRGRDQLLVRDGLKPGERLITTDLSSPVPGMPLRTVPQAPGARKENPPPGQGTAGKGRVPAPEKRAGKNGGLPAARQADGKQVSTPAAPPPTAGGKR